MVAINSSYVGPVKGVIDGSAAKAGDVGERADANASGVAITTATQTNIISISLTPGDWDVWAQGVFTPAATTTVTGYEASLGTASGVINNTIGFFGMTGFPVGNVPGNTYKNTIHVGPQRYSLTATTTIYLVGFVSYGTSTLTAEGWIHAVRIR